MSPFAGLDESGKAALQHRNDLARVVERKSRLREKGDARRIGDLDDLGLLEGTDQADRVRRLTERSDRLVVLLVADQDDRVSAAGKVDRLEMHLRHERAGCVDRAQAFGGGGIADLRRNSCAE